MQVLRSGYARAAGAVTRRPCAALDWRGLLGRSDPIGVHRDEGVHRVGVDVREELLAEVVELLRALTVDDHGVERAVIDLEGPDVAGADALEREDPVARVVTATVEDEGLAK